jgi:hypothetical protein
VGCQANCEQRYAYTGGVEEVVAALGEHRERVGADTHRYQSGHKCEVQREDHEQALCSGHK